MTTPDSPQDPQDPQDLQDPTRPVEEHPATRGTDDTAVIEDDATQKVETAGSTTWAPAVAASPAPAASATPGPTAAPFASASPGASAEPADSATVAELPRPTGPHAPAIVLGIVCLAIAILVIAQEVGSLKVDWGDVGPLGIVAAGAMLVLFGLLGLLTSRRNQG